MLSQSNLINEFGRLSKLVILFSLQCNSINESGRLSKLVISFQPQCNLVIPETKLSKLVILLPPQCNSINEFRMSFSEEKSFSSFRNEGYLNLLFYFHYKLIQLMILEYLFL